MPYRLNRPRLFALLDALEQDVRALIREELLLDRSMSELLGGLTAVASERRDSDPAASADTDLLEYIDFQDAIQLLHSYKEDLTSDAHLLVQEIGYTLLNLSPVRNRVMHGRPLLEDDPQQVSSATSGALRRRDLFTTVATVNKRLVNDPFLAPQIELTPDPEVRALTNIPLPDYDDTGLIGRSKDVDKIVKWASDARNPVVTLTGIGGVGKTALALAALHKLVRSPECPYDAVLWTTLKQEQLTGEGILSIPNAARDMLTAVQDVEGSLGHELDDETVRVRDLDEIPTLLVIDNLETTDPTAALELYDELPETVQLLITSRIGIQQLERRYQVQPLSEKDAVQLLRRFARSQGQEDLARLPQDKAVRVVRRLDNNPLELKWFVSAVDAGRAPDELLANQGEFLNFALGSIVDSLSEGACGLLNSMQMLARSATAHELAYLTDLQSDKVRNALLELEARSVMEVDTHVTTTVERAWKLADPVTKYLKDVRPPSKATRQEFYRRMEELRTAEARREADESSRRLAPNVVHTRTVHDAPAAKELREALRRSKEDFDLPGALTDIQAVKELKPDYFETYRVEGFVRSHHGDPEAADRAYEKAYEVAEDGDQRGVVCYFHALHVRNHGRDPERAYELASEAHEELQLPDTAVAVGQTAAIKGDYQGAREHLQRAMKEAAGKSRLIATTAFVTVCKRQSEFLLEEERRPESAVEVGVEGYEVGTRLREQGVEDQKLGKARLEAYGQSLAAFAATEGELAEGVQERLRNATEDLVSENEMLRWLREWQPVERKIREVVVQADDDDLRYLLQRCLEESESDLARDDSRVRGRIARWLGERGFGFVEVGHPNDVFLHVSELRDPAMQLFLEEGVIVEGVVAEAEKGLQLQDVVARGAAVENVRGRGLQGHVQELGDKGEIYVREQESGARLRVSASSVDRGDWESFTPGVKVQFVADVTERGLVASKVRIME